MPYSAQRRRNIRERGNAMLNGASQSRISRRRLYRGRARCGCSAHPNYVLLTAPRPNASRRSNADIMLVLGIETTCDETAAAVVECGADANGAILANIVLSQIADHAAFGGVVPEIAARAHVEALDAVIAAAMTEAGKTFAALDGVAAAAGPGLIGGLIVGLTTAKAIAMVHEKPLIAVNHLEAHALTARLTDATPFPYCLFLASGGHTQIVAVCGVGDYVQLGTTRDDAIVLQQILHNPRGATLETVLLALSILHRLALSDPPDRV